MKTFLQRIRNPFSPGTGRFALLLSLIAVSLHASAFEFEYEGIKYESSSDFEVRVASNNSVSGDVVIPQTVQNEGITYRVTAIGEKAFCECKELISITLPEGVTEIGSFAFYNCSSLTSITIPESVTKIGESAFWNCSSLSSITLPESVTEIDFHAFSGCSSLSSITLPRRSYKD